MASIAQEDRAPIGCPTEYLIALGKIPLGRLKPAFGFHLGVKYSLLTKRFCQAKPNSSPKISERILVCNQIGNLSVAAERSYEYRGTLPQGILVNGFN
jgi:hypothetical protein